jgi:hypothetical protein
MSIGKYISIALSVLFFVAIALGEEEGLVVWIFVAIITGALYGFGCMIYTSGKAKIYAGVASSHGSAEKKAEVSVILGDMVFRKGITNSEGKCTFYLPTGNGYRFKAKKDDYESAEEFLDVSDKSMRGISLVLSSRNVSVIVKNEHDAPVKDASVNARASTYTMSEHTNAHGKCLFKLPFEPGDLTVEKDGYAPAKITLEEYDTIAYVKLEPKFVNVRVEVVDEREQPIEGASVKIGKSKKSKSFVTNERGVVEAETRVGTQEINVETKDFLPFNTTVNVSTDFVQRVSLKEPRGQLELRTVDAVSGEYLSATVTLLLFGSRAVDGKQEGVGRVLFDDIPIGTHQLRSTAEGYYEKEMAVEISEGENVLEIPLEPLSALSETLVHELTSIEEGLHTTVSRLSQSYDVVIPRYFQSYCLTLLQLARRLPQGANLPAGTTVEVIKDVCKDVIGLTEEKKQFYTTTRTEEETVELPSKEGDFYDAFKELIKDPGLFYNAHNGRIQQRIKEVDRKITDKMVDYEISPVTSLWKLAKKLAGMREEMAKNAICLLFADIALDFTERIFVIKEVAERLKKK